MGFLESIGEISDDELTPKMKVSLLSLIQNLINKYPLIQFLGGHKEFDSDRACPGDLTMAQMDQWRSSTGLMAPEPVK